MSEILGPLNAYRIPTCHCGLHHLPVLAWVANKGEEGTNNWIIRGEWTVSDNPPPHVPRSVRCSRNSNFGTPPTLDEGEN